MERRIAFTGALNFRDLGGYMTSDGGQTAWGRLFRSDSLHFLAEEDLTLFDSLGVRSIVDLRTIAEVGENPGPRPYIHLEFPTRIVASSDFGALRTRAHGEAWLNASYREAVEHGTAMFGRLIGLLVEADCLPAVIHCFGGKDRTGLATALVLLAVGVDTETVLDDYELTNRFRPPDDESIEFFVSLGMTSDAAVGMLSAPRWAMADALELTDSAYGGIASYLQRCGVDRVAHERLTALLRS